MTEGEIYLDYNATTPVDPAVLEAMLPWFTSEFGNAASVHPRGRRALGAVEHAREQVAALLGVSPRRSSGPLARPKPTTCALKGAVEASPPGRGRVLLGATEHKAVLDTGEWLLSQGATVDLVPVDADGLPDATALRELLDDDVAVVSVMLANNETGVIAPVAELADLAHEVGALFHTDATQAPGRIPVDLSELGVDLASFSAHKMYGPKGIGCLYVSRSVRLAPHMHGGGHERGLRSGTLNVPGIVGFGAAAALAAEKEPADSSRYRALVESLVGGLQERVDGVELVAAGAPRLPNTANLRFHGTDGEAVMANAPLVAISSGSACTSQVPTASHVLRAMGMTDAEAAECLRFSVGRQTSNTTSSKRWHNSRAPWRGFASSTEVRAMRLESACKPVFARHETFHPRYGWVKKAYDAGAKDPHVFNEDMAVVRLGVGKNMVKSIRHWGHAFRV